MIRFQTDNDVDGLDLPLDAAVTVTAMNPVFDSENADRSFSYPLKCPWTAHNITVLKSAHRVDSSVDIEQIELSMFLDETLFETGVGMIEADSDRDFELTFKSSTNAVLEALEQLKINELLDVINIPQPNYAIWAFSIPTNPGQPCAIRLDDQEFSETTIDSPDQTIPMSALVASINAEFPNIASFQSNVLTISDPTSLYPNLKIFTFMKAIASKNHSEAKQENFLHYLSSQFVNPSASHRFPVIWNPDFFEKSKKPLNFSGYINFQKRAATGVLTQGKNEISEEINMANAYVPFLRLRYILDKISTKIGVPIRFNFPESVQFGEFLLWNNQTLDELTEEWHAIFSSSTIPLAKEPKLKFLNHFRATIDLNEHVTDESAKDFFEKIANCFDLYFVVEDGAIVFQKKQNVVKGEAIDWTEKRADGFTRKRKKRVGFTLDYTRDEADSVVMAAPNLQKYVSGDGGNVVRVPFHTFPTRTVDGMKIPFSAQQGSTVYDGIGKKNYNFALLFDRGIQTTADGFDYYQADYETPELSLRFEGSTGLFAHFFEGVVELSDGAIYAFILNLSASELANLRLWQSAKRYFLTETGTVLGVIRNVQFKASRKGIEAARVEVVAYP